MRPLLACLVFLLAAPQEPDVEAPGGFWKRLGEAEPGEWRWTFKEKAQTLAAYKEAAPTRATPPRSRIYLQPYLTRPGRDPELLGRVARGLSAFFGAEVVTLPRRPLPADAYIRTRRQVSGLRLAPHLVRALPADALFLLAVTDRDLFVGKLAETYGWGSFKLRVGVMSTNRLGMGGADAAVRLRRAVTLATHEAGHMLSIPHCVFYRCLMNGARTLPEADRRPALLCPVCREKLCWNLGLDPLDRYGQLDEAYQAVGMANEAEKIRTAANVTRSSKKS